jgi:hypothetical protein
MTQKCLLIKTKDNRKFLTHEKNLNSLIEFSKTFGAEIFTVPMTPDLSMLELKDLVAALCNPQYVNCEEFSEAKKIFPVTKKDRGSILSDAKLIREYIKTQLLTGHVVSLKEIRDKYKTQNLTDACLCNHITTIRKSLIKEGYSFRKLGAGKYCLAST